MRKLMSGKLRLAVLTFVSLVVISGFPSVTLAQTIGTLRYLDGSRYVGEVIGNVPNGRGSLIWPNGQRIVGVFRNGRLEGQGTSILPDGRRYVGEFHNGNPEGQGTSYFPNGAIRSSGLWHDGQFTGRTVALATPPRSTEPGSTDSTQTQNVRVTSTNQGSATNGAIEADPNSTSYQRGATERDDWETWFNSLQGSRKDGAEYWTGQRSLKVPVPCRANTGSYDADWLAGCTEASQRLAVSDYLRKTDPQYWNGWNRKAVAVTPQPDLDKVIAASRVDSGTKAEITSAPPPSATEPVLARWTGVSMMTTRPFHVDGSWELQWSVSTGHFSVWVVKDAGERKLVASQTESGSSSSYVSTGGDYYLEVEAEGPWTIKAVSVFNGPRDAVVHDQSVSTPPVPSPAIPVSNVLPSPTGSPSIGSDTGTPRDEAAVIQIVGAAISQFKTGKNEMEGGAARPTRARALCNVLSSRRAINWTGTVTKLSTNGEGRGILEIQIARDIFVKTWNNALSDTFDNTLIDPQSNLFRTASQLHEGQKVRFAGTFPTSDTDCIEEPSLTLEGSITEPEFIIRFESVVAME
jgi:hypothetical protein